jgi:hypothetical protein
MTFVFRLPGGGEVVPPEGLWPDVSIPVGASVTLYWPGLPGTAFDALRDGFDAVVDPGHAIPEVNDDNNTLHVAPSTSVRVEFLRVRTPDSCGWFVINADYVFRLYAGYGPAAPAPVHWVMSNFRVPPVGDLHGPVGGEFNIAGPATTALFDLSTDQSVHVFASGAEHDFWGDHYMGFIHQWHGTGAGDYTASSVNPGCHFEIDYRVSPVP